MIPEPGTGQSRLIEEVLDKGLCVRCGACVGFCPYFSYFDGQVVVMDRCQATGDRCYQVCPVVNHLEAGSTQVLPSLENQPIGPVERVLMARATDADIRHTAQYGGVVSALMTYALERGIIDSAILTDRGGLFSPEGREIQNKTDVHRYSGSRYTASGTLTALNQAVKKPGNTIGVVGLPCQMDALARMGASTEDPDDLKDRIRLTLGLFCTWALDYRKVAGYLEKEGVKGPFLKFDIPPPPAEIFQVKTDAGWREFPLSGIRPCIQKGCLLCEDMTAEKSDISVGVVEGEEGWNTVIVRTQRGDALMGRASEDGRIETRDLPQENLDHLKEAVRAKRERGKRVRNDQ